MEAVCRGNIPAFTTKRLIDVNIKKSTFIIVFSKDGVDNKIELSVGK